MFVREWVCPIEGGRVRVDGHGLGKFMASREGGQRLHLGVDITGEPGCLVLMPADGVILRESFPYLKNTEWRGALIQVNNLQINMFYMVLYSGLLGTRVKAGTPIGVLQDISRKYPANMLMGKMLPHLHMQVSVMALHGVVQGQPTGSDVFIDPGIFFSF